MEKFLEWHFRLKAIMLAVDWECEFNPLGMEKKSRSISAAFLAVEAVASYRHPESLLRCGMHPQLVGAPRLWMKLYAASSI